MATLRFSIQLFLAASALAVLLGAGPNDSNRFLPPTTSPMIVQQDDSVTSGVDFSARALSIVDSSLGGDELWWSGFFPPGAVGPPGLSTDVYISAFATYRGELIAAGRNLAFMDGIETAGTARSNGTAWVPLGGGPGFMIVNCLAVLGDRLMAGGLNGAAGGPVIAEWDGKRWKPFAPKVLSEPWSEVNEFAVLDGSLIASGNLYRESGPVIFIMRWDGANWEDIGPDSLYGGYPFIADIGVYRDTLYVAGAFRLASDDSIGNVARWHDNTWEIVDRGTNGAAYTLEVFRDQLVVGGRFNQAGQIAARNIAAWNGGGWTNLGAGVASSPPRDSFVGNLLTAGDRLVAAGDFDSAGSVAAPDLAVWNGDWDAPLPALDGQLGPRTALPGSRTGLSLAEPSAFPATISALKAWWPGAADQSGNSCRPGRSNSQGIPWRSSERQRDSSARASSPCRDASPSLLPSPAGMVQPGTICRQDPTSP